MNHVFFGRARIFSDFPVHPLRCCAVLAFVYLCAYQLPRLLHVIPVTLGGPILRVDRAETMVDGLPRAASLKVALREDPDAPTTKRGILQHMAHLLDFQWSNDIIWGRGGGCGHDFLRTT